MLECSWVLQKALIDLMSLFRSVATRCPAAPAHSTCCRYLHIIYYLHRIYTVSTEYLQSIYTVSTEYLHSIYRVSTEYLQSIYRVSTQYLHSIYYPCTRLTRLLGGTWRQCTAAGRGSWWRSSARAPHTRYRVIHKYLGGWSIITRWHFRWTCARRTVTAAATRSTSWSRPPASPSSCWPRQRWSCSISIIIYSYLHNYLHTSESRWRRPSRRRAWARWWRWWWASPWASSASSSWSSSPSSPRAPGPGKREGANIFQHLKYFSRLQTGAGGSCPARGLSVARGGARAGAGTAPPSAPTWRWVSSLIFQRRGVSDILTSPPPDNFLFLFSPCHIFFASFKLSPVFIWFLTTVIFKYDGCFNYLFYLGVEAPLTHNRTPTIPSCVWCSYLLWRGLRPDPEFKLFLISTITFTILQRCSEKRLSTDKIIPFLSLKDLKLIGKSYISKSRKNNKSLLKAFKLNVVFLKRIKKLALKLR